MSDLSKLPYAKWLEQSLQNIITNQVHSICIISKVIDENGEDLIGTGYWKCNQSDKLVFAGYLQHDAILDTMRINGYITDDEDNENEEEEEKEEEEEDNLHNE